MPALARLGDPITCGDTLGHGSGNVFANGLPLTRIQIDLTAGHCFAPTPIASGSPTVFCNTVALARVGDPIIEPIHGCPGAGTHPGNVANGSPDVRSDIGGAASMIDAISPVTAQQIVDSHEETRQEGVSPYTDASHLADDEGAPDESGGEVPFTQAQVYVAAAAKLEGVDIQTPPTVVDTAVTAPAPAAPPAGNYDYSDIDAAENFPDSYPLSPNYVLGQVSSKCVVSKYPVKAQTTGGKQYTQKDIVKNLRDLCYNILEPMRAAYGGLSVNSGFRHGNGKSQHERGQAADVAFAGMGTNSSVAYERAKVIADSDLPYDQFIFEQNNTIWFHVSYDRTKGSQRRMVMTKPRGVDRPRAGLSKVV